MIIKLTKYDGTEHSILVEIDEQGNVKAQVEGVQGPACSDISAFLDEMGQVTRDEETPEFYQTISDAAYQQTW